MLPSRHLLVQSQQWKHRNNVWNLLKRFNIPMNIPCHRLFFWRDCKISQISWTASSKEYLIENHTRKVNCLELAKPARNLFLEIQSPLRFSGNIFREKKNLHDIHLQPELWYKTNSSLIKVTTITQNIACILVAAFMNA